MSPGWDFVFNFNQECFNKYISDNYHLLMRGNWIYTFHDILLYINIIFEYHVARGVPFVSQLGEGVP